MGANAQTAVPTFTASQVLTADQMNQSARTGVPVFASTVTRDAAFGGTGEKTLAEGQLCYVEGTGLQTYNGSAWVTWGTTDSVLVTKAKTTFSSVSSITVDNAFVSGYEFYRVVVNYTTSGATADSEFFLRVGGVNAATNYNLQWIAGESTTASAFRSTGRTSMPFCPRTNGAFNSTSSIEIYQPNVATGTTFNALVSQSSGAYTSPRNYLMSGNHSTATAYDGFQITLATDTMSGHYTVYGYRT
jgi:hypothetical protein